MSARCLFNARLFPSVKHSSFKSTQALHGSFSLDFIEVPMPSTHRQLSFHVAFNVATYTRYT